MDSDQETEQGSSKAKKRSGRTWTERYSPATIPYRRWVDKDAGGRHYIFLKFEMNPGQNELPEEVRSILQELKYLPPSHGNKPQPTGLKFVNDARHGRVVKIPDTPTGRFAADLADQRLFALADLLDHEQGRG